MKTLPLLITIVFAATSLYAQSKKEPEIVFPTYQQIKPADSEIIDFAPKPDQPKAYQRTARFNLFDYPANTVTYVLNGKSTKDAKLVKGVVDKAQINKIHIYQPTDDGKRVIEIDTQTNDK